MAEWCTEWAVGHASAQECDALGMTRALRLAARRALAELSAPARGGAPGRVLRLRTPMPDSTPTEAPAPRAPTPVGATPTVRTVVKGDATCLSIAAASIMAKVTRDRMMRSWSESFPPFDFDRNKGYPSPSHRTALSGFGLTSIHRRSWSFVDDLAFR